MKKFLIISGLLLLAALVATVLVYVFIASKIIPAEPPLKAITHV